MNKSPDDSSKTPVLQEVELTPENIQALPEETRVQLAHTLWQGPLPPPQVLEEYKAVSPDSVKIILEMAQGANALNQKHLENHAYALATQREALRERAALSRSSQNKALIAIILLVGGYCLVVLYGSEIASANAHKVFYAVAAMFTVALGLRKIFPSKGE
jgi:uncharacterized membrane protein